MANISSNNIITINRGDTFIFSFNIQLGTGFYKESYQLQEGDKVYLGVMEANQPFEDAIIKKVFDHTDANSDGTVDIKFDPRDTLNLLPGNYYYSIKLSQPEGGLNTKVTTLIQKTRFIILD